MLKSEIKMNDIYIEILFGVRCNRNSALSKLRLFPTIIQISPEYEQYVIEDQSIRTRSLVIEYSIHLRGQELAESNDLISPTGLYYPCTVISCSDYEKAAKYEAKRLFELARLLGIQAPHSRFIKIRDDIDPEDLDIKFKNFLRKSTLQTILGL